MLAARDLCAQVGQRGARYFEEKSAIDAFGQRGEARLRQEFVYGGELAEEIRLVGGKNAAFVWCHGAISTQNARGGEGSKGDGQGATKRENA